MHFSATSYLMAILSVSCLICFLYMIMKDRRIPQRLSIRFLRYFSLFILLRLMLPFEFFHTITIPSEHILPTIIDFCNELVLFTIRDTAITLSWLLLSVWVCGIIYIVWKTVRNYKKLYDIIPYFPNLADDPDSKIPEILESVYKTNPVRHPVKKVIRTKFVNTPCIIGFFSPVIFLPALDLTPEELYCVLYHELSHLRHIDFIWMLFTEILCIINWWNPLIRLLRTEMTTIMEFHADNTVFSDLAPEYRELYLDCLIKIARNQQIGSPLPVMSLPFSTHTQSFLGRRILRLIESESCRPFADVLVKGIAVLLLIVSTMFIIEPAWMPVNGAGGEYYLTDSSYLLMQPDGSYDLYIDENTYIGTIHERNVEGIQELPVYCAE